MANDLELEIAGEVAFISLARRDALGAMTIEMWEELGSLLADLSEREDLRAVVVRSRNRKVFSPGLDLKQLAGLPPEELPKRLQAEETALYRLENLPVPTLAVVSGWALGAGCGLAVACDLRIADETARFGLPVARFGLMASAQMIQRFVVTVGPGLTKELLYTGRVIGAEEARRWGLVNQVVSPDKLDDTVDEWVAAIRRGAPRAVRAAKRAVSLCLPLTVSYGMPPSAPYFIQPEEFQEGIRAFLEGREPDWEALRLATGSRVTDEG